MNKCQDVVNSSFCACTGIIQYFIVLRQKFIAFNSCYTKIEKLNYSLCVTFTIDIQYVVSVVSETATLISEPVFS